MFPSILKAVLKKNQKINFLNRTLKSVFDFMDSLSLESEQVLEAAAVHPEPGKDDQTGNAVPVLREQL